MSHKTAQLNIGDVVETRKTQCYNRTGATLLKGQVAMVDKAGTQAETTEPYGVGSVNGPWANLTPCTQAGVDNGYEVYVCLDDSVADNAAGNFGICGVFEVAVLDDDVSATDVDRGDALQILVSESATAVSEWLSKATTGARHVGVAHEDAAADSTVTARTVDATSHLRWCHWWGGVAGLGTSDT